MTNINVLGEYDNGNTHVIIYSDGTKVRHIKDDQLNCQFPECVDVNVSYRCDGGCKFCYQNSTKDGQIANLSSDTVIQWLDSITPYTELALNCNDPLMDGFEQFLVQCKKRNIIANITINQKHLLRYFDIIKHWQDNRLIHGVGVSIQNATEKTLSALENIDNVVVHLIVGATSPKTVYNVCNRRLNALFLGYKVLGRGESYQRIYDDLIAYNTKWLYRNIDRLINRFNVVGFDNLAVRQLNVKRFIKDWDSFFMGDDGTHSMYVDLVNHQISVSSTTSKSQRFDFPIDNNIRSMFDIVKTNR